MIKTLRLHNFKTYLNASVDFSPVHLIIGRNNSGKTNLCAALRFLNGVATMDFANLINSITGGLHELTNWALDSDRFEIECICETEFQSAPIEYTYRLLARIQASSRHVHEGQLSFVVEAEELRANGDGLRDVSLLNSDGERAQVLNEEAYQRGEVEHTASTRAPNDATMLHKLYELETNQRAIRFRQYLQNISYFTLSTFAIRFHWREGLGAQSLSLSGHSLASALFHLKNWDERRYRRVIEFVQAQAEPDLEAINFVATPDQVPVPFVALRSRPRASWSALSDGTLYVLALGYIIEIASALADAGQPGTMIIEEPENGIYPGQLRRVFERVEDRAPRTQFIFTSHSPYFINLFDGSRNCVTLLTRNKERTEISTPPPPDLNDPERELLAEEYSMELLG